jgi:hypothetical protein
MTGARKDFNENAFSEAVELTFDHTFGILKDLIPRTLTSFAYSAKFPYGKGKNYQLK